MKLTKSASEYSAFKLYFKFVRFVIIPYSCEVLDKNFLRLSSFSSIIFNGSFS